MNGYSPGTGSSGAPGGYLPIEEHGIVGDLRTVALVGTNGTVDWYCPSRFDAPSLFGSLLDARRGGYFSLSSRTSGRAKQMYLPDTNILVTRSFWYVEALTHAGRVKEARMTFEKMLTYANHVGLYAEQVGHSGEALGNFPQAFTHLALISAALNLDQALDRR